MMSGVGSIPNMTIVPSPVMGNEMPPEYIVDQGVSYPAAENYAYGYTGYESSGEWGDHHNVFGLDGHDLHYMGLQAGGLPCLYYTPGYGYAQTPFNQYTPYVPGSVTGLDGSYVGVQHYMNVPSYQPSISSPAYIPVMVQPNSDYVPTSSIDQFPVGTATSIATRPANVGATITPQQSSVSAASCRITNPATSLVLPDASQTSQNNQASARPSEGLKINIPQNNQSLSQETLVHGSGHQGINSGQTQSTFQFSHGRNPFIPSHLKVAAPSNSGLTTYVPNVPGWASQDKQRQGPHFTDIANGASRNLDILGEQNKGPRKSRPKDQLTSSGVESAELTQSSSGALGGCIVISPDQYNKNDFPVDYPDAKFFVIKSYSEDDVHKSVKYNVWSSTHNGNRRLDSAYADSQRKTLGQQRKCPVFLFFSVNASGQFCGLAEMVGPVDFDKDMNFWQQDKWSGSFPVKWHIIKDVPNSSLRHIVLENNENKPVTNSRDTQEIPYSAGINMLKIFKTSQLRTSILDDFKFYEERQKKMLEDKFRHLGRIYEASLYVPAFVSSDRPDAKGDQSYRVDENQPGVTGQIAQAVGDQTDNASEQSVKYKEKMQDDTASRPLKIDGKHSGLVVDQSQKRDGKHSGLVVDQSQKTDGKHSGLVVDQSQKTDGKQLNTAVGLAFKVDGSHSTDSIDLLPVANGSQPSTVVQPPKPDKKKLSPVMNQLPKVHTGPLNPEIPKKLDGKQLKWRISQPPPSDGNAIRPKDVNGVGKAGSDEEQFKNVHTSEFSSKKNTQPNLAANGEGKSGMLSVESKQSAVRSLGTIELEVVPTDFVKVGSMQIKVKDLGESSSRVISAGAVPVEPKGPKLASKKSTSADSNQPKK
ncbi:hypothetical protein Cni_G27184 [Canna indica]|uniref:YTH domain-containing protein n=1 Tax=Canna indica TaxID=4628 RepID=A0AAQ3QP22_9LILI|nr:hypothetical protein Cni_G27184 [Canna indica]